MKDHYQDRNQDHRYVTDFGKYTRIFIILMLCSFSAKAQELYVFTEPASNMPSKSFGIGYKGKFLRGYHSGKIEQRHSADAQFEFTRNLMLHVGTTFSNMYSQNFRWESVNTILKYRFFSKDGIHRHFRMAAFAEGSYSRNVPFYDEISFEGDQSGIRIGLIGTQLLHKLALSSTLSLSEVLNEKRWEKSGFPDPYSYEAFNYSLSAGYLLLPFRYTDFKQTNVNLYLELLGSKSLDKSLYYVDLAPAIQFIINSTVKLNAGYRFQLDGNMHRMSTNSILISAEATFLNLLKRKQ